MPEAWKLTRMSEAFGCKNSLIFSLQGTAHNLELHFRQNMSTLWVWCESELLLKPRLLCYMLYVFTFTFATWVKQCCNWRNVCQTVFYFDRFGNVFQFDESWPHKWLCNFGSRFQGVLDWNLFLPCLCQDKVFSLTSLPAPLGIHFVTMKRTATKASTPPLQEIRHKVSNYLTLHVALNPSSPNYRMTSQSCLTPILKGSDSGQILSKLLNVPTTSCPGHRLTAMLQSRHTLRSTWYARLAALAWDTCSSQRMASSKRESDQGATAGMDPCTGAWKDRTMPIAPSTSFVFSRMSIPKLYSLFHRVFSGGGSIRMPPFLHYDRGFD